MHSLLLLDILLPSFFLCDSLDSPQCGSSISSRPELATVSHIFHHLTQKKWASCWPSCGISLEMKVCFQFKTLYVLCNQCMSIILFVEHKIVLVGLDNAGKTTILYQFLMNEVVHTSPTIGSNVEEVVWKNIHFIMWDLGGQESLRAAWNTYYTNTEVQSYNLN